MHLSSLHEQHRPACGGVAVQCICATGTFSTIMRLTFTAPYARRHAFPGAARDLLCLWPTQQLPQAGAPRVCMPARPPSPSTTKLNRCSIRLSAGVTAFQWAAASMALYVHCSHDKRGSPHEAHELHKVHLSTAGPRVCFPASRGRCRGLQKRMAGPAAAPACVELRSRLHRWCHERQASEPAA
jgi:hypothetical protein